MNGPYPRHHRCPKCDGAVIRRKLSVYPDGEALDWHCNECSYDWRSRTWDQPPLADECTCWIHERDKDCNVHPPEPEKDSPRKSGLKSAADIVDSIRKSMPNPVDITDEELP